MTEEMTTTTTDATTTTAEAEAMTEAEATPTPEVIAPLQTMTNEEIATEVKAVLKMPPKEKIMRLHELLGITAIPLTPAMKKELLRHYPTPERLNETCRKVIWLLENAIHDLKLIQELPDFEIAKTEYIKVMACVVDNGAGSLHDWTKFLLGEDSVLYPDTDSNTDTNEAEADTDTEESDNNDVTEGSTKRGDPDR